MVRLMMTLTGLVRLVPMMLGSATKSASDGMAYSSPANVTMPLPRPDAIRDPPGRCNRMRGLCRPYCLPGRI